MASVAASADTPSLRLLVLVLLLLLLLWDPQQQQQHGGRGRPQSGLPNPLGAACFYDNSKIKCVDFFPIFIFFLTLFLLSSLSLYLSLLALFRSEIDNTREKRF